MIQFTCPHCGKKLRAKAVLEGQTRSCPNCKQPVRILPEDVENANVEELESIPLDDAEPGEHVIPATEDHLPVYRPPERLARESHYLICDKTWLVATWENNGPGWMIRSGAGFIPAKRNHDKLPTVGNFQLVELKFHLTPEGKRLTGLTCYQLAPRYALTVLDQGDDAIAEKIVGRGCLNREQKLAVRNALKEQFMRPVWDGAAAVLEYLGNTDYHSHGAECPAA